MFFSSIPNLTLCQDYRRNGFKCEILIMVICEIISYLQKLRHKLNVWKFFTKCTITNVLAPAPVLYCAA